MRFDPVRLARLVLLLLLCGLAAGSSTAASPLIPLGPGGGNVFALAMDPSDPSTIYAMTNNGLYRSEDAGASWTLASPTVNLTGQIALAIDPARPWTVYSGSNGLLERSDDRGRSWTGYSNPLLLGLNSLAVAPGRPSTLFASAGTRLLRSEDAGESWEILPFDQPSWNLAVHPRRPQTIFLLSNTNAHKSEDGGRTWSALLPHGQMPAALALAPSRPETVYVATVGATWRSRDGGRTWTRLPRNARPEVRVRQLAVAPDDPETVYAATDHGVRGSRNGGFSWHNASAGLPGGPQGVLRVMSILIDPSQPATLYAGILPESPSGEPGVARSWNGGRRWHLGLQRGLTAARVLARLDRATPGTIYAVAGHAGGWPTYVRGFRSLDRGRRWEPFPLPPGGASDLQIAPGAIYAGNEKGVWRSRDEGRTWRRVDRAPTHLLAVAARGTILAGGGGAMRRSIDEGRTWQPVAYGGVEPDHLLDELIVEPSDPERVYAKAINFLGTGPIVMIFRSEDAGATWSPFLEGGVTMAIAPSDPRMIYVFSNSGRLLCTHDRGATWSEVSRAFGPTAMTVDPLDPDTVYAGTREILRSTDGGQTWETLDATFAWVSQFYFSGLAVSPWTPGKLYAWGTGLFELRE